MIREDGTDGERFEVKQPMSAPPLTQHPETGEPVQQVFLPPHLILRYSEGTQKKMLDNKSIEQKGFTKYERDQSSGQYHRVAGNEGPETLRP